ncbi:OmpA family protein [Acuticoccus mangrovi]|uniref:OmpA family protein n=1 Tax=Acuticoccus mangrovi TaxID=2796142 RepID=A0A934MFV2_9HYPH|nr:OmpA family protein [Acuticoccus mangrovi]MBJ3774281.1 OmpA family protein [Acuticoccus mangrovi]
MTILRSLIGTAVVLGALASVEASAQGQPAANEINRIIQELGPTHGAAANTPAYRKKIRRVTVPVRPNIAAENAYTTNSIIEQRTYVLNYNHTEDFTVHFAFDSFAITPKAAAILDIVGEALTDPRLAGEVYLVGGHTDTVGSDDYNQWLSEKRADAVVRYLVRTFAINPSRLLPVGYGESQLADPRRGAVRANRRVEFTLVELPPEAAPRPVATRQPPVHAAPVGNVTCDSQAVSLSDPRPATHGLDDYGSPRTPVECEDQHVRTPDEAPRPNREADAAPITGTNDAINSTNSAIAN